MAANMDLWKFDDIVLSDKVLNTDVLNTDVLNTTVLDRDDEVLGDNNKFPLDKDIFPDKLIILRYENANRLYSGDDYEFHDDENYFPDIPDRNKLINTINDYKKKWREELNVAENKDITNEFLLERLRLTLRAAAHLTDVAYQYVAFRSTDVGPNEDAVNNIVNRFAQNERGTYNMPAILQDEAWNSEYLNSLAMGIINRFRERMIGVNGDITKIGTPDEELTRNTKLPYFNHRNTNTALHAVIGGVQQLEVRLKRIKFFKHSEQGKIAKALNMKTFGFDLEMACLDDFGINATDITRPTSKIVEIFGMEGLCTFWVLQNHRGYRPFVTTISKTFYAEGFV